VDQLRAENKGGEAETIVIGADGEQQQHQVDDGDAQSCF
jgi:hypothetical protein